VQDDISAPFGFLYGLQAVFRGAVTGPFHGVCSFFPGLRDDVHLLGNHERGVESQPKVTDNRVGVCFVLFQEFLSTGEGDLVDVLVDFIGRHADAPVGYGQGFLFLVQADTDGQVA